MTISNPPKGKTRLFIIDDSSANRRVLSRIFESDPEVEVVGEAGDGEEALRLVAQLKPDIITLDLEMPRMDGFTFLRILMARQPTPTIVVSSFSQRENVFKALELGALDFVAKADRQISNDSQDLERQVRTKVHGFRRSSSALQIVRSIAAREKSHLVEKPTYVKPSHLVVIGASTGGPSALLEIFSAIPRGSNIGIVVAQHMPDKFTRTFAERLDRKGTIRTREAESNDVLSAGTAYVCPGRRCIEIDTVADELRVRVRGETANDRYLPSADALFTSAVKVAATLKIPLIGVVLTGMGDDAVEGARAIANAGGRVIVESRETAVVYGMPREVVERKIKCDELPLPKIAEVFARL